MPTIPVVALPSGAQSSVTLPEPVVTTGPVPPAPACIRASAGTAANSVVLDWSDVTWPAGTTNRRYEVHEDLFNGVDTLVATVTDSIRTSGSLTAGNYRYYVKALDSNGSSVNGPKLAVTVPVATPVDAPPGCSGISSVPTLTSIAPNPAPAGPVTLNGTNFAAGATVSFGGAPATNVTVVSATQITCTAPAHADGSVNVTVTTGAGTSNVVSFTYQASTGTTASSVSRHGITWNFDHAYPVGTFVNGDPWVVGPVTVVSVSPAPTTGPIAGESDADLAGETGLRNDKSRRHGSQVVLVHGDGQTHGYDSRAINYNAALSQTFPTTLAVNRSLVSSISNGHIPNPFVQADMMATTISGEQQGPQVMQTAAVLTCLATAPPADAFRPPYYGTDKRIFRASNVRWDRLQNVPRPSGTNFFSQSNPFAQYEPYVDRVWLDHMDANWTGQWLWPSRNVPNYGREYARVLGAAGCLLNTNATQAQKQKLLYSLIQVGIDNNGLVKGGAVFRAAGGHASGRKFPIVFAGLMLNDDSWFDQSPTAAPTETVENRPLGVFAEDVQTYYGRTYYGSKNVYQMVNYSFAVPKYMERNPSTWTSDDQRSDTYRLISNRAWVAQALCILLMSGKARWNHNVFFDYMDDWMAKPDPYAAARAAAGATRHSYETTSWEPWITALWVAQRNNVPAQPNGANDLAWDHTARIWVANPKP